MTSSSVPTHDLLVDVADLSGTVSQAENTRSWYAAASIAHDLLLELLDMGVVTGAIRAASLGGSVLLEATFGRSVL